MNDIIELNNDTYWYKKIRNGCWRTYKGNKKLSEHSMEEGAKNYLNNVDFIKDKK